MLSIVRFLSWNFKNFFKHIELKMGENLPLLLSAALGKKVNRPPVWMMRQAGRYMKIYRDLRDRYPSFREMSENPELSY